MAARRKAPTRKGTRRKKPRKSPPSSGQTTTSEPRRPAPPARFVLAEAVRRERHAQPFEGDPPPGGEAAGWPNPPPTRRLAVYTQDPAAPRADIAVAIAEVPFEPLEPGPGGCVVRVVDFDETSGLTWDPLDLDRLDARFVAGLEPSTVDPRFAQQMTYAVAVRTYEAFRGALGRTPDFAFEPSADDGGRLRLLIRPHAMQEDNAYYDPDQGALLFGYTSAGAHALGPDQPGAVVFTSLSHDVVAHETAHALLDGMRAKLMLPSNPDVDAFHEAFADLVALFLRFGYRDLVQRAIADGKGAATSRLLTDFASQFGRATGDGESPLRTALLAAGDLGKPVEEGHRYHPEKEAHDLGAVLVAAVFDAFRYLYERKTSKLRQLVEGEPARRSSEFTGMLAEEAQKLAGQFLNIVIRAVDYCPPVDLTFGEYLRALITADRDLVRDDPWGYRETFVRAFRRYGVTVQGVPDLSEHALLWRPPECDCGALRDVAFENLRQDLEPGRPLPPKESARVATAIGELVTDPERCWYFGLALPSRGSGRTDSAVVESVRALRRIGPDGSLRFDLVAEITQRRKLRSGPWVYGGTTVIFDSRGRVRYAINKNVASERREEDLLATLQRRQELRRIFTAERPDMGSLFRRLHGHRSRRSAPVT